MTHPEQQDEQRLLTRRRFSVGAAGVAVTLAAASYGLTGCSADTSEPDEEEEATRTPDFDDLQSTSLLDLTATSNGATLVASYELPLGSQVWVDDDRFAAVLSRGETVMPMSVVNALDLGSGAVTTVIPESLKDPLRFSLYDVRMSANAIVWVEVDHITDEWVVFAAPFDGSLDPDAATQVDTGTTDYSPPFLAIWKDRIFWTKMPDPSGPARREDSELRTWSLGDSAAEVMMTSPGRFACPPTISQGILTVVPRVEESGTRYRIVALNVDAGDAQLDELVMPRSVRPFGATYLESGFGFSVEADYGFGGILGRMGSFIGPSTGPFLVVNREPRAEMTKQGGCYAIKDQASTLVFDPELQTYYRIPAPDGALDHGDYPATLGLNDRLHLFAQVNDIQTGLPHATLLRSFTLK